MATALFTSILFLSKLVLMGMIIRRNYIVDMYNLGILGPVH